MTSTRKEHWNKIYADTPVPHLGWHEPKAWPSIRFIENCAVPKDGSVVDIGSGATTLIGSLLELGYQNLCAVDISQTALEKAKDLLSKGQAARVRWLVEDITNPSVVHRLPKAAVWHDRAVFHFLTESKDRQTYHFVVDHTVLPSGFVIMAAFALTGAPMCSGLPVRRYSVDSLGEFLGDGFRLIESLEYTYQMPSGDLRPYVYARFQKANETGHTLAARDSLSRSDAGRDG